MDQIISTFGISGTAILLLMLAAFVAGFVDAIAGGGGLINLPSLMLAGLDPVQAVATNKLLGSLGVASATASYAKAGLIDWRAARFQIICSFAGAGLGAIAAQHVPIGALRTWVPLAMIGVAIFLSFSPKLTDAESHQRISPLAFALTFALAIGFYDGIFGPGGGTFYFIALVMLSGQGVLRAAANTKLLNLASNLGAFALFAFSGKIFWLTGLAMGIFAMFGAQLGARTALVRGASVIKPMVVIVSVIMAIRLILDKTNPIGAWLYGIGS